MRSRLPSVATVREKTSMTHAIRANRAQRFLLPPSMDEWLPSSHPARFVSDLVEVLDLKALGFRMSPGEEGRPHFAAELLLSVWLFGWMDRIRSTRALERACLRDIAFVWLTGNLHPDHNTLWRFFRDNKQALKRLFKHVVRTATEMGLVGFALHALDGTKLPAASSTEMAAHRKQLEEKLKELDAWIDAGVAAVEANEQRSRTGRCPRRCRVRRSAESAFARRLRNWTRRTWTTCTPRNLRHAS
jgi:transposase